MACRGKFQCVADSPGTPTTRDTAAPTSVTARARGSLRPFIRMSAVSRGVLSGEPRGGDLVLFILRSFTSFTNIWNGDCGRCRLIAGWLAGWPFAVARESLVFKPTLCSMLVSGVFLLLSSIWATDGLDALSGLLYDGAKG